MVDETEKKIMDAALKNFSKYGYKAATTMDIARDAGVNDSTLFRRFKSKKNLYNVVNKHNIEVIARGFNSIIKNYKCETPAAFLNTFIKDLAKMFDDNFEFIHLTIEEASPTYESVTDGFIDVLQEYIERNIKNDKIDYQALTLTIFGVSYMSVQAKHKSRSSFDLDNTLEGFIKNTILCVENKL
jgi:TetR/AcrR family transcriptional regulator